MPEITTTTTPPAGGVGSATRPADAPRGLDNAQLGKEDFLHLFVTQLRQQDPMNPVNDKDFMAQIAQLTSVEQLTTISASLERMDFGSQVAQAVALIGKTVTWDDGVGGSGEGLAAALAFGDDGRMLLTIGPDQVEPAYVRAVR
jgi:flagellar basal-body rod modification protein FlgD